MRETQVRPAISFSGLFLTVPHRCIDGVPQASGSGDEDPDQRSQEKDAWLAVSQVKGGATTFLLNWQTMLLP